MKALAVRAELAERSQDHSRVWLIEDAESWTPRKVLVAAVTSAEVNALADALRPRRRWRVIAMSRPL